MADRAASPVSVDAVDVASRRRQQRRQMHREVVARSRVRQRERVLELVQQETELREQLTQLLLARQRASDAASIGRLYAELVASQENLLRENEALETLVHRHYLFGRLVQFERGYVLDEGNDETRPTTKKTTKKSDASMANQQLRGVWLRFVADGSPIFYEHESPSQSAYLVSVCFHLTNYLSTVFDEEKILQVDVAHVLGWNAQRAIQWNDETQKQMLYFKFSRTVSTSQATLHDIQKTSWNVLSSPAMQARLYSVPVTTQIAQAINDNAQIVLQHKAYNHVSLWFYSLNAQALEPGVVRQSMMVLDKQPPEGDPTKLGVVWLREGIICLTFRESPKRDTVEVEFAGCMRCINERHAQFMLIDVGCVLVRWENLVLPSRLLL